MRLGSNSVIRELLTNQSISIILDGSFVIVYLFVILWSSLSSDGWSWVSVDCRYLWRLLPEAGSGIWRSASLNRNPRSKATWSRR